jgi:synaptobrevin family protein YKT6
MKILYIGVRAPHSPPTYPSPSPSITPLTPSLQILKNFDKPAIELCAERDLTSFSRFTRSNVGEFLTVFAKTVAERTQAGQRQDVEEQSYTFHAYARSEGVCGMIISDHEYPKMVAHQLLSKIMDEFLTKNPRSAWENSNGEVPFPALKEYIVKFQDPHAADSIMKVSGEQGHTKGHQSRVPRTRL